ncbi:hypothetical protein FK178_05000 [Antarcticibacterium arcticum]|uniref:Aerotolerance regulator N-terminal domain-containing protein n=1 Tax=Antarcticibacterium arcticum TaxID=2585771 RepID=A0A5B8YJU6_9FLAO|nr:BatA domain-containing protein [Antarcticibacterium arcticum]QED37107.1 hypothetical protein FK178_05000 [Antarcticibacterium arcticum]
MQFNNPEVLFALFLLIIPVIIHLFQLRKFKKESFTNVKFLKKITPQTRKSSQLKKWLVLATRLLLLACIIMAFARPYFPSGNPESQNIETVIYLDNSYSMQATGTRGRLLDRSVQDLLSQMPEDRTFTLITNNDEIEEVTRQDLQEITYSASQADLKSVFLRAGNKFSADPRVTKKLLLISDFPGNLEIPEEFTGKDFEIYALPRQGQRRGNISIDSLYQEFERPGEQIVKVRFSYTGNNPGSVPVSLFNGPVLLGKSSIDFTKEEEFYEIGFPLEDSEISRGKITVEDNGLEFDNSLYFSVNKNLPVTVTSINSGEAGFLQRIFSGPEFDYNAMPATGINYNTLTASRVIILNELQDLSASMASTLTNLAASKEVVFIIIPSVEAAGPGMNSFLRTIGFSGFGEPIAEERLITNISFNHPVFSGVFEEQVKNFEYPKVQLSYGPGTGGKTVLSYENNNAFLLENRGNYFFTAPLNSTNSNFTQSPLIVPVFYNMGISALKPAQLYYELGRANKVDVPVKLPGDRILKITSAEENFIPQQRRFTNKVEIITEDLPQQPGNFNIILEEEGGPLISISYNIPRTESKSDYVEISDKDKFTILEELPQFFSSAGFVKELDTLWKWFVTFALIFLIIETLLLKYFK